MQFENGKGVFNTGALPLEQTFNLSLELKDSDSTLIFFSETTQIKISSISQTETIPLKSTRGTAILELQASHDGPVQILAVLPISVSRKPENYGDLFFTEIFADPKTSGDDYEYMEIYNATLDTLELSDCRVAKSITVSTVGRDRLNMPEDLVLPPMELLFFGRDSVENADFNYKSFTLTNTGQSLGFFCGSNTIDTLNFSTSVDKSFPLKTGTPMQLPLSNYENRTKGSSWCFGFSPKQDAICQ
jgi:hypothetical protein